jgi:hypothetical protein
MRGRVYRDGMAPVATALRTDAPEVQRLRARGKTPAGDQHRDEERGHSKNILAHNGSVVVAKVRREKALDSSGLNSTALQSALIPRSPDLR